MEKDLLKAIIEELGAAALEAVSGKKFATLAVRFAVSIMTRDIVLDKLIGLFGSNQTTLAAYIASKGVSVKVSSFPEPTIDEMEAALAVEIAAA